MEIILNIDVEIKIHKLGIVSSLLLIGVSHEKKESKCFTVYTFHSLSLLFVCFFCGTRV